MIPNIDDLKKSSYSESSNPKKCFEDWMKEIPDNVLLSSLTIPGTHDSCAYKIKGLANIISYAARTQTWDLENQLKAGLRYFDARLRLFNNTLHCFHGPIDLIDTFDIILKTLVNFVTKHKSETIMMQLVSEYDDTNCTKTMEEMYEEYTHDYKDLIKEYDGNVPTMGEVRGHIFFIKIFKGSTRSIPNFYIQNYWSCNTISKIGKKKKKIRTQFHRSLTENDESNFFLNYLSCSSDYILMSPLAAAKECNKVVFDYKGRLGIVLCDFPGEGLIEYLIMQNFGEENGEEKELSNVELKNSNIELNSDIVSNANSNSNIDVNVDSSINSNVNLNEGGNEVMSSVVLFESNSIEEKYPNISASTNSCVLRGRKKNKEMFSSVNNPIFHSCISAGNFGISKIFEEEDICNNDYILIKHVDTNSHLFYHEDRNELYCNKKGQTVFNIIGTKKIIEDGDEIALIVGLNIFVGRIHKKSDKVKNIKNNSLVLIELERENEDKMKYLNTSYENKCKGLKGMLNINFVDMENKDFSFYFMIIKTNEKNN
jgi:1-phosphatidylinositol phosphodiesterase